MKFLNSRILCVLVGLAAVLGAQPTLADDSEVFTSSSFKTGAGVRPNVLFIIDTSGSMDSEVITYDPTVTYSGTCDKNYIYWKPWASDDNSTPPDCTKTTQKITLNANRCHDMYAGIQSDGWYNGLVQQLNNDNSKATAWADLTAGQYDRKVECQNDAGVHGDANWDGTDSGTKKYPVNNSTVGDSARWTTKSSTTGVVSWKNKPRVNFYSANYINWFNAPETASGAGSVIKTRLEIVKQVASNVIDNLTDVNLGLMRYSNNEGNSGQEYEAQGGMVTYAMSPLTDTTRTQMKALINSYTANGWTPLSETLYEAQQYLSGGSVVYGDNSKLNASTPSLSVAGSRTGGVMSSHTYDSPMDFSCQNTYVVYLTDGLPTQDNQADTAIQALPGFATDGFVSTADGGGGAKCPTNGPETTAGRCMVNLAGYMHKHDYRSDVDGAQTVTTYIVGFGSDVSTSLSYLNSIAKAGGGKAYTQTDAVGLTAALTEIFTDVVQGANSTFVSPTVAVNAFNRTRNLNSLYVSVFAPTARTHWPGNVKKYQFKNGQIYGGNAAPAVDPNTGFFADGTVDLFNPSPGTPDGPNVPLGGMASVLPAWASRNVYTYLDATAVPTPSTDLTNANNAFATSNALITNAMLGLSSTSLKRTDVMEFMRGRDVNDENGNKDYTDERKAMGDPMHSRPGVAIYSGTEDAPQGLVYVTTNDGFLHAIDMNDGKEKWAFIPPEMMLRASNLQRDPVLTARSYGIDGDVRVFKYDANGNGIVDTGDKVYVLFGFGRGGGTYYALDVTSQTTPRFLWKKRAADLPALGDAWSTPTITRVNVKSNLQTDPQKLVAIFGAGYDTGQDNYHYVEDGKGTGIYMLELSSGNLLWSAGGASSTANLKLADMKSAIPSDITVLDINGDTYADRMYVGDMGGRIWRFDIWHGQAPADLVSGGVLANLGAGYLLTNPAADTTIDPYKSNARRFYYAPDVALVSARGSTPYVNIAIGSGYRGHPLDKDVSDRFYSIRDYQPFTRRTTASYTAVGYKPITDDSLVDVTTNLTASVTDGSNGWKIIMQGAGEKVLAESITANGVIQFPSFTPTGVNAVNPCLATTLNRAWQVWLDSGLPYVVKDATKPTAPERYTELKQGGIAPGTAIIMTQDASKKSRDPICLNGVEAKKCPTIGSVTRTYWERQ